MQIISIVVGIAALVCWIMVLVALFKNGDILAGVLSICPLVGFIMGWIRVNKYNLMPVMLVWTGCIVVNLILNVVIGAGRM
jgi:hypothetical protein